MLLTAGLGTRLRPVTDRHPKPAVPFLNVPLLCYPLRLLKDAGATSLVMNTHHLPEQIEAVARKHAASDFKLAFSHEPGQPLGAGGGIGHARAHLRGEGAFLVANGDEVILPREPGIMRRFVDEHRKSGALASILVMEHPLVGTQFGGVWATSDGRVLGFGKNPAAFPGTKGYHYIGLLLLEEEVLDFIGPGESNILYDALTKAIADGHLVKTCVGDFTWYETGNPRDFLEASKHALELHAEGRGHDADELRAITRRYWSAGTKLEGSTRLIGSGARVDAGAKLEGFAVIGDEAVVEKGARLRDAVILPAATAREGESIQERIHF